jgi:DNA-binding MurR/RpiR family transcriptional regulator
MPSKADEFRAHAADCDEQARKVASLILRERFVENARWWRELAAQTERQTTTIIRYAPSEGSELSCSPS